MTSRCAQTDGDYFILHTAYLDFMKIYLLTVKPSQLNNSAEVCVGFHFQCSSVSYVQAFFFLNIKDDNRSSAGSCPLFSFFFSDDL